MTDFIVKAVPIDGLNWPLRSLLQSLDSRELGDTEWWRRMAMLQNAAARAGDEKLLGALDEKKKRRWGTCFEAPEVIITNNLPPLALEECIKKWFLNLSTEKQEEFLTKAISTLLEATNTDGSKKLFTKKQDWMAVYMVLRDRLSMIFQLKDFHLFATKITPTLCPSNLKISSSTMTNFSKVVPEGPYFKMSSKQIPFHSICTSLWNIIKNMYFAQDFTNE